MRLKIPLCLRGPGSNSNGRGMINSLKYQPADLVLEVVIHNLITVNTEVLTIS